MYFINKFIFLEKNQIIDDSEQLVDIDTSVRKKLNNKNSIFGNSILIVYYSSLMTDKSDLYDKLMAKSKAAKTEKLAKKKARLEKRIAKLTIKIYKINERDIFYHDDNSGNALMNVKDRIDILADMKAKFLPARFNYRTRDIASLFYHVDNIRYAYQEENLECPQWFTKKYANSA